MRRHIALFAAVVGVASLLGCIDTDTKVTVKPDGSGTIEKTIIVSKHLINLMMAMGTGKGDAGSTQQSLLSEANMKNAAGQMGSGVSLLSDQKVSTDKGSGYKAVYIFTDINKLKLNQNPAADITLPANPSGSSQSTGPQYITFSFTKGSPCSLTITPPKPVAPTSKPAQTAKPDDQMMASMRALYSDLRIVIAFQIQGTIQQTNAAYVDGSTITLMDMDFSKILSDDATFKKLTSSNSQSMSDVATLLKSSPGVKLDTQESLTVKFQ